jgi:hypothetical protein
MVSPPTTLCSTERAQSERPCSKRMGVVRPASRIGECELAYNDAGKEEEVPTGHAKLDTLRPERVRTYPLQALRTCQRLIRRPTCPRRKTLQQTGARV